jgi:hypothetical protein
MQDDAPNDVVGTMPLNAWINVGLRASLANQKSLGYVVE